MGQSRELLGRHSCSPLGEHDATCKVYTFENDFTALFNIDPDTGDIFPGCEARKVSHTQDRCLGGGLVVTKDFNL